MVFVSIVNEPFVLTKYRAEEAPPLESETIEIISGMRCNIDFIAAGI